MRGIAHGIPPDCQRDDSYVFFLTTSSIRADYAIVQHTHHPSTLVGEKITVGELLA